MNLIKKFDETPSFTLETPDMDFWPIEFEIEDVQIRDGDIVVRWNDHKTSSFLPLWLREQCPCRVCHSDITRETLMDVTDIPVDVQAVQVRLDDKGYVVVHWSTDGHASCFNPGWLRANSYDGWAQAVQMKIRPTWDHNFQIPDFDALQILNDDDHLCEWLTALDTYGLTLVRNVPTQSKAVLEMAKRIGQVRSTNFGTMFEVVSKPDADSNAYLSVELPLHMDLPTRETPPGLQFLHCMVNDAKGGDSVLADAFHLAKILKVEAPDVYETITGVNYSFKNRSLICDYQASGPLIRLDEAGNPVEHRINTFLTSPITHLPRDELKNALEAKHHLLHMLQEERFKIQYKMGSGDMIAFDNRRVLHARTEFFPNTGSRLLEGCYVDRDELGSALRMLAREKRRLKCG